MIALTGGIAMGKSTVLGILEGLGAKTASADALVRAMYDEPWVQDRLAALTGRPLPIRPRDVASVVLENPRLRQAYGAIFHGPVMDGLMESGADVAEIPLLVETCSQRLFSSVWCVICEPEEQKKRLIQRTGDSALAEAFLRAQLPARTKAAFADLVVRTDDPFPHVLSRVTQAWTDGVAGAGKSCYTRLA